MTPFYSKAYLSTQVNTSDRLALVIALYESALAHVTQAMEAVEAQDAARRGDAIRKTAEILMSLSEVLDYTQQHQIAGRLFSLYNFLLQQLLEANRNNDLEALQTVKSTLSILLEGWNEAARSPEAVALRQANAALEAPLRAGSERSALVLTA